MKTTSITRIAGLLALGAPCALHAQATVPASDTLETFNVVGSKEEAATLPGSAYFLDAVELDNLQIDDINRALRKVPGVYVREEDGFGLFPNVSLRGVDTTRSGKVTLMEDGILTSPAPYSAPSAYYSPEAGRMHGIEVLKGSSQIEYGPHTTGGAINYISQPIPETFGGEATFAFGTDDAVRWSGHLGGFTETSIGKIGAMVEYYHRENDGFKNLDTGGDTGLEREEFTVKVAWEPKTKAYHYFEAKAGYTDLQADTGYLGLTSADFAADPYRAYAASQFDQINTNHSRFYLRHVMQPDPDWKVTTTAYYNKFHRNWYKLDNVQTAALATFKSGSPFGTPGVDNSLSNGSSLSSSLFNSSPRYGVLTGDAAGYLEVKANNRDYYLGGIQSIATHTFQTGEAAHTLEGGLRFHVDRIRRFQWSDTYEQDATGTITGIFRGQDDFAGAEGNRRQESEAISVFLKDEIAINTWTVTPGVRWEHIDYQYTDWNTDTSSASFGTVSGHDSGSLDVFSPGIGVTKQLNEQTLLFAGYHRGISVPGPRGHVKSGVDEETSDAFEFGARYFNESGLGAEAVIFYTHFNDLLVVDSVGGGGGDPENVGEIDSLGLELVLSYDPAIARDWAFNLPLSLAFTYTDATLDGDASSTDPESVFAGGKDGNRVPYIPEYQLNASAGFEMKPVRAYLSATFADETFTSASNTTLEVNPETGAADARFGKTDSYFIVDASAFLEITPQVEVFLRVNNVFDEEYLATRHPHGPRPGAPRTALVGAKFTF